jgi:hypothetical protein
MVSLDFGSQYTTIQMQPEWGFLFNKYLCKWTAAIPLEHGYIKLHPVQIRVLQKYIIENTFPLYKTNHLQQIYQWTYFRTERPENTGKPKIKRFDRVLKKLDKKE